MTNSDRFRLFFGPYAAPRFRYGQVVSCAVRGEVVIVGLSAGRIQWPIGRRRGTSARGPIVEAGLARAVKRESNQAVCHWWGVTGQTVTKWRKALEVGPSTDGTATLKRERRNSSDKRLNDLSSETSLSISPFSACVAAILQPL